MTTAFIDDGYTEDATLAEIPGISPPIKFSFRPMTASEIGEYVHVIDKLTEPEAKREAAKRLAKSISAWDVRTGKGETVEIKQENFLKLKQLAFSGLWDIVQGRKSGDRLETDLKN